MKLTNGRTNIELIAEMQLRANSPSIINIIATDFTNYMDMVDFISQDHNLDSTTISIALQQ